MSKADADGNPFTTGGAVRNWRVSETLFPVDVTAVRFVTACLHQWPSVCCLSCFPLAVGCKVKCTGCAQSFCETCFHQLCKLLQHSLKQTG